MKFLIPKEISQIIRLIIKAGFNAYIVGGSVRDLLIKNGAPKDWDIATDAKPEEIQKIFPDSIYENRFGTVGIKTGSKTPSIAIVEVTTFRREEKYSDLRHPDKVVFTDNIEEDLARRDFTINALALNLSKGTAEEIIDPFHGREDLKNKIIRAVGDPNKRFSEDALRMMRAVRFSAELGFSIEDKTKKAIQKSSKLLKSIAKERIRDELVKIIMSDDGGPYSGIVELEKLGLLEYIMPELREGIGVAQNKHHIYTVWEHNLLALDYSARQNYSFEVRLASLLHDVAKPRVKDGEGENATFYNHEVVGGKMARQVLMRLKFSKNIVDTVSHLVRWHLFYYNVGEVTEAGVRRFVRKVGLEHIEDLLKVREADRIGSGVPKAVPYKLRHLKFMIEKAKTAPISPKMLKISGDDIMKILKIAPGPKIGWILAILLEEVIDEPKKNDKKLLSERAMELGKTEDAKLRKLAKSAMDAKYEFDSGIEAEMKKKYYVK